jgi:hypothetical protein
LTKRTVSKMDAPREVLDIPAEFAPVASAFAGCRDVTTERGWRSGGVTLKAGGKIFAMLVEGKFVAKLPRDRVRELVRERWPSVAREAYAFVVSRKRRGAR